MGMLCLLGSYAVAQNNATGVFSTEISYQWTDSSQYLIRFKVVYDCSAGGNFSFSYLDVDNHRDPDTLTKDTSFQLPFSAFTLISSKDVTPILSSCPDQSRCSGTLPYGWKELVYQAPLHLDSFANCLWTVSYTACCRASFLTNVAANQGHYNFCEFNQCYKNSGYMFNNPFPYALMDKRDLQFAPQPEELAPERDSISIALVTAYRSKGNPLAYQSPYSASRPLNFFGFPNQNLQVPAGLHVNPQSGDIQFRPVQMKQATVMVLELTEWRNTDSIMLPIGRSRKDFIVGIDSLTKPADPKINVPGSTWYQEICASDTLDLLFPIKGTSGTPTMISYNGNIPSMQIVNNGSDSLHLSWTPQASDKGIHRVVVEVSDSTCPYQSKVSRTLVINVRDSVKVTGPYAGADKNIVYASQLNLQGTFSLSGKYPVQWTTAGDGTFIPDSLLRTVYMLGPLDSATACRLDFVLSVSNIPGCFIMPLRDTTSLFLQNPQPEIQKTGQTDAADTLIFAVLNTKNLPFTLQHNGQGIASVNQAGASFLYFPSTAEKTGATVLFTVEITRCGTTEDTLSSFILNTVSLNEPVDDKAVYPNPFSGYLIIDMTAGGYEEGELVLSGANGQEVLREPFTSGSTLVLDTSDLPPGLYFVKLPGLPAKKVIKTR